MSSLRSLSQQGLESLLAVLDRDREQAGQKYETLRRKLLTFFEGRNCHPADELADESLDRVSRKLSEGLVLQLPEAGPYVYGVARNVAREALERAARTPHPIQLGPASDHVCDPASLEPSTTDVDHALRCMDRCLDTFPIETRQLLLVYHSDPHRGRLSEGLGIEAGALRVRMHRLRKRLESCVRDCMEGKP